MKLELEKNGEVLKFTPQEKIDYYYLGIIHGKVANLIEITSNTDNPEKKVKSLKIRKEELIHKLIK